MIAGIVAFWVCLNVQPNVCRRELTVADSCDEDVAVEAILDWLISEPFLKHFHLSWRRDGADDGAGRPVDCVEQEFDET